MSYKLLSKVLEIRSLYLMGVVDHPLRIVTGHKALAAVEVDHTTVDRVRLDDGLVEVDQVGTFR